MYARTRSRSQSGNGPREITAKWKTKTNTNVKSVFIVVYFHQHHAATINEYLYNYGTCTCVHINVDFSWQLSEIHITYMKDICSSLVRTKFFDPPVLFNWSCQSIVSVVSSSISHSFFLSFPFSSIRIK